MRWQPRDETKWHRWFAWYPVQCRRGSTVWIETVWRRQKYHGAVFELYEYAVFEERPDITEDGQIPEGTP